MYALQVIGAIARCIMRRHRPGGRTALLDDMRQFMRQQMISRAGARFVLACAKNDVVADRIGQCIDRTRGFRRSRIRVHPDTTEIGTKARFHRSTGGLGQRLPSRCEYLMHDRRGFGTCLVIGSGVLSRNAIRAARFALFLTAPAALTAQHALDGPITQRAMKIPGSHSRDYLVGHAIRFFFIDVVGRADRKLCLQKSGAERFLKGAVADGSLQVGEGIVE